MPIFGALMGFSLFLNAVVAPFSTTTTSHITPTVPVVHSYVATLTAYNAVPAQTDSSPFITASGMPSNPEVVMARSRDLASQLPFGTIVELDGSSITSKKTCGFNAVSPMIGYRIVADTMNARYTDRVDVLLGTHQNFTKKNGTKVNAANVLGICDGVTVRVVGHINLSSITSFPKTQAELAALVHTHENTLALK